MNIRYPFQFVLACAVLCALSAQSPTWAAEASPRGQEIFAQTCAECHGDKGQGVAGAADDALYGSRTLEELTKTINDTMPEGEPEACTGEEAQRVATYIYETFYTAEARAKSQTARVELLHMTVPQYRQSVADLLATFLGRAEAGEEQGLSAEYYNERRRRRDKLVLERTDATVDFDYGEGPSLKEKVNKDEFFIRWEGSLVVEESGSYEIIVRTGNGMRLWLNDEDKALIDAWVSSGGKVMEHRATVELLAGRAYPLHIEYFKHRDKTASIQLLWKPPHKTEELIPPRHLRTREVPPTFVVTTPFPPDDRSVGYERGSAVSASWDEATTYAALETAQFVVDHIDRLSGSKEGQKDRLEKWQQFCERFVERAFRRPLTDQQKQFFVKQRFEQAEDSELALKQVVLLTLKSPRFLYLGIEHDQPSFDYTVASRLSFGLWNSLPDEALLQAASRGELHTQQQVAQHARRMLDDPRAKAKLREFFHAWLLLEHADDLSKDEELYPDFNEQIVADLRTSLDLMLDSIAWNEQSDFRQLLLADTMFVNRRLAEFYQVGDPSKLSNETFEPVELNETQRAGVMTHPYMLAALAYRQASSPIHRGVFLTRKVMNRPLNPPPAAIEFNDGRFDPHLTMREKVTELTKAEACQSCHRIINPLGFSLENFDAVGRYREIEKEKPIDTKSDYTSIDGKTFTLTSARDVAEFAAASENSQAGFVESLLHHQVQQPAAAYGPETLKQLRDDFAGAEFSIRELIVDIMKHTALHNVDQ